MVRLYLAESFLHEVAELPEAIEPDIWRKVALIEAVPGVGSSLVSCSLAKSFGPGCLKVAVGGYDILYRRNETGDDTRVDILGVIAQRAVR